MCIFIHSSSITSFPRKDLSPPRSFAFTPFSVLNYHAPFMLFLMTTNFSFSPLSLFSTCNVKAYLSWRTLPLTILSLQAFFHFLLVWMLYTSYDLQHFFFTQKILMMPFIEHPQGCQDIKFHVPFKVIITLENLQHTEVNHFFLHEILFFQELQTAF